MELFANNAQTTLGGGITSGNTSFTVASATAFPSTGNFRILIDNELMLVTAVSGSTFVVSRGVEGTTAAAHAFGSTVTHIATNGAMQGFRADTNNQGAFANRPAAGHAGVQYAATDARVLSVDNGTTWSTFGPIFPLTDPTTNSFSWVNQSSATVSTQYGGIYLSSPPVGAAAISIYETTLNNNTGTVTLLAALNGDFVNGTGWNAGFSLRAPSAGNQVYTFGATVVPGSYSTASFAWTSPTAFSSSLQSVSIGPYPSAIGHYVWFQRTIVSGNQRWSISGDGITWALIGNVSSTAALSGTPTKVGIFVNNQLTTGENIGLHLLSFAQT